MTHGRGVTPGGVTIPGVSLRNKRAKEVIQRRVATPTADTADAHQEKGATASDFQEASVSRTGAAANPVTVQLSGTWLKVRLVPIARVDLVSMTVPWPSPSEIKIRELLFV